MSEYLPQDMEATQRDWQVVGGYLTSAVHEIATDLGGEEFAVRVSGLTASDELLPNADALKLLEDSYPGSIERVMARMSEIQQETHKRDLAELRKPSIRRYGQAVLRGFVGFNIFGSPIRRR